MTPMSQRRYRREKGSICPFCRSHDTEGGFVEVNNGKAVQEMNCLECDKTWLAEYELTKYEEVA